MSTTQLPTLYCLDSNKRLRQWTIFIEENKYWMESGLVDGAKVTTEPQIAESKNIGKTNETTPKMQAMYEAQSRWDKQKKTGYVEGKDQAEKAGGFYQVMLAKKWEDRKSKIQYPLYVQPKLDGIRNTMTEEGSLSRNNTPIEVIEHIEEEAKDFFARYPGARLDGELYNHELKHNFEKIISVARKKRPTRNPHEPFSKWSNKAKAFDKAVAESKLYMQYWIYDIPTLGYTSDLDETAPYSKRFLDVVEIFRDYKYIKIVPTRIVHTEQEFDDLHSLYLNDGYEGSIARFDTGYENKRSAMLLKRKDFMDIEVKVVGIEPGTGNWAGKAKRINCVLGNKSFNSNIKGSMEYLEQVYNERDSYVGKSATLKFFRYTNDGIPYLPYVTKLAREDAEGVQ